jgi:hypothetical protein
MTRMYHKIVRVEVLKRTRQFIYYVNVLDCGHRVAGRSKLLPPAIGEMRCPTCAIKFNAELVRDRSKNV